jgi:peptide/histidine transporter 3/4
MWSRRNRKTEKTSKTRPLGWSDSTGATYSYYENPLRNVCIFILVQEACERLAFYGISPNLQIFLRNTLGISEVEANSRVNIFNFVIYFTPMISAVISDTWLGSFLTILVFSGFYIAGLLLLNIASIPSLGSPWMVYMSLYGLIALGAGGIKSCVNILGGAQYHPEVHVKEITRFFTFFYAAINVGGIVGGIVVPIVQQATGSYFIGYLIPLGAFGIATLVFLIGSPRYVKMAPQGSNVVRIVEVLWASITRCTPFSALKESSGGRFKDSFIDDTKSLLYLLPIFALTVPFNVCYNQMTTAFLSQGLKLKSDFFGVPMTPSLMQNIDPIAVIVFSFLVEYLMYNKLRAANKMPSILTRFFIGCCMGTLALLCAMGLEFAIMSSNNPQESVSIWLQVPQFSFIALGEIFLISTSYEVAFTYAPEPLKALGSALNLLFLAIAAGISAGLVELCAPWMPDYDSSIPATWQNCHYDYYFMMLASVCFASGFVALALNPYFKRHVTKPVDRYRKGNGQTEDRDTARVMTDDGETVNGIEVLGA